MQSGVGPDASRRPRAVLSAATPAIEPRSTVEFLQIEKQLAKTKQLKEHIISNQQAPEQLLKALLHGAFEVEETLAV